MIFIPFIENAFKHSHVDSLADAWVNISLNKILGNRETVSEVTILDESADLKSEFAIESEIPTPLTDYKHTVLGSYQEAQKVFRSQENGTRRRSQCYNRAHVWTYEMSKRKITAGKVWLFFTSRYIKEYKYKWWFHVAPYVKVEGEAEDTVMDRKFTKNPAPLTVWKDIFIYNRANCPTVEYYSDYRDNHFNGNKFCYIIKSSMYYWQPFNIENLEKGEAPKKSWDRGELEQAHKNAVSGWDGELR